MPHLTLSADLKDGPIVDLQVGVSTQRRIVLEQQGKRTPAWVRIKGLIDTGAECTLVESAVLESLEIE